MKPLAITAVGAVTPVGSSAEGSCAAIRCGMVRAGPIELLSVWDPDGEVEVPAIGHRIRDLSLGYQGIGRWLSLARPALHDLLRHSGLRGSDRDAWKNCGLLLCLPEADGDRYDYVQEELHVLPGRLVAELGLSIPSSHALVVAKGHSGVLIALQKAAGAIEQGTWNRAIVLGVDSLVDAASLAWLAQTRRLKTADRPRGIIPGEAAACILVEGPAQATARKAGILGSLESLAIGCREPGARHEEGQKGETLARCVEDSAGPVAGRGSVIGDVVCDLNGEEDRSAEWGFALARLNQRGLDLRPAWILPASSVGDTGAASGALALVVGVRSLARSYARSGTILVWTSSDNGDVAACVLGRGPGGGETPVLERR